MTLKPSISIAGKFKRFSIILSSMVSLIGLFVLIGWVGNSTILKSIYPDWVSMKANAAICFFLSGITLILINKDRHGKLEKILIPSFSFIIILIGTLTLFQYFFHFNIGIDEMLFHDDNIGNSTIYPGRLPPIATTCFILVGLSLLALWFKKTNPFIYQFVNVTIGILAFITLTSYFFGVKKIFENDGSNLFSFHGSVASILLTLAIFFVQPEKGIMKLVSGNTLGGKLFRVLFPLFLFIPFLLFWLYEEGERANFYNHNLGGAIFITMLSFIFTIILFFNGLSLSRKEKKIKEGELRYRSVIEQATDAICIVDATLKFLDVNPYACRLFGYTREEALQLHLSDIFFIEDIAKDPLKIEKFISSEPVRRERRMRRKDGAALVMDVSAKFTEDGNFLMFGHDITQRRNDELGNQLLGEIIQLLNEPYSLSETLNKMVEKIVSTGNFSMAEAWLIKKDQNTINLVARFIDTIPLPLYHYEGNFAEIFVKGEGLPGIAWQTNTIQCLQNIEERKDLISKVALSIPGLKTAYALPIVSNNEVLGVFVLATNKAVQVAGNFSSLFDNWGIQIGNAIKRKQVEEELQVIFNSAPDIICVVGIDGFVKTINPAGNNLFGLSNEEFTKSPFLSFVHPDDYEKTSIALAGLYASIETVALEIRFVTRSGKTVWLLWSVTSSPTDGLLYSVGKEITEKKELENLLNKANELAGIGSWEVDLVAGTTYWSNITKKLHEVPDSFVPDVQTGINFYKAGKDRNRISTKVSDALEFGKPWDEEIMIVTANGNERWIRTIGEAEFIDGKCIRLYGSFQDIDQRKKGEIQIQESESRFRLATTSAAMGIWHWNLKNDQLVWDKRMYQIYDISDSQLGSIYEGWLSRVHPEDKDRANANVQTAIAEKKREYSSDFRIIWGDLSVHYIKATGLTEFDDDGNVIRMMGINWDVTETKLAEEEILKLNRLYVFTAGINEMIIRVTDDTTLFSEACRIAIDHGKFKMAWIGIINDVTKNVDAVNHAGEESGYFSMIKSISAKDIPGGRGPVGTSIRDGSYIVCNDIENDPLMALWKEAAVGRGYLSCMSLPIRKFEKIIGAYTLYASTKDFFDTSEIELLVEATNNLGFALELFEKEYSRKAVEEEIITLNASLENIVKKRTEQLELLNQEMEAFTYSVSHDLRAPLRGIIGFTTMLEEDYTSKMDDEAKRITTVIKNNTLRMGKLIDDLLSFSRIGRQQIIKTKINTNKMVKEIITELTNTKGHQHIEWTIPVLPAIKADPSSIRQVWVNLLSNAIKYSSKNDKPHIEIGSIAKDEETQFFIKDNGVGFDEKYKDKLFKVFQRLHSTDEFEGTGVGLAIVEKIITKHGGKVWAGAIEHKGATFNFTIPNNPIYKS